MLLSMGALLPPSYSPPCTLWNRDTQGCRCPYAALRPSQHPPSGKGRAQVKAWKAKVWRIYYILKKPCSPPQPSATSPCYAVVPTGRERQTEGEYFQQKTLMQGLHPLGWQDNSYIPHLFMPLQGNSGSPSGFCTKKVDIRTKKEDFCKMGGKTGAGPSPPSSPWPSTAPSPLIHQHCQLKNRTIPPYPLDIINNNSNSKK